MTLFSIYHELCMKYFPNQTYPVKIGDLASPAENEEFIEISIIFVG